MPRQRPTSDLPLGLPRWMFAGVAVIVGMAIVGVAQSADSDTAEESATAARSAAPSMTTSAAPTTSRAPLAAAPAEPPERSSTAPAAAVSPTSGSGPGRGAGAALVTRVIDGDTFVVQGGDRVRVLGIDSCESSTSAGSEATAAARRVLGGQVVNLRREGSADRDRYGRLPRYVDVPGVGDLGRYLVADGSHTGIYEGRGDASASYVASLRSLGGARSCGSGSTPARTTAASPAPAPAPAQPAAPSGPFKNCRAAWAAGAAPVHVGSPGYGSHLDRDGDGIGCEVRPR
jgi:micrococcal nuclease